MIHSQANALVFFSFLKRYQAEFRSELIEANESQNLLDIGSGIGVLKSVSEQYRLDYLGIEPSSSSYCYSANRFGKEFFLHSNLENAHENLISMKKNVSPFDIVVAVSCLDEVNDKLRFLAVLKSFCHKKTRVFLIVRNKSFPLVAFRRNKMAVEDLTYYQWKELFIEAGFEIQFVKKSFRPWINSLNMTLAPNFLYRIASAFLPVRNSYMLKFQLKLAEKC